MERGERREERGERREERGERREERGERREERGKDWRHEVEKRTMQESSGGRLKRRGMKTNDKLENTTLLWTR